MAMPRRPPRHHNLNSSAGLSTAASALILSADRPFAGGRPNWPPLEARSFEPHLPRTAAGRTRTIAAVARSGPFLSNDLLAVLIEASLINKARYARDQRFGFNASL